LIGKQLEAVVVDPASNWPLFAEKGRELISKDKVAAIFGAWTSVSRTLVLPAVELAVVVENSAFEPEAGAYDSHSHETTKHHSHEH
jgi:ABC-type branched-subunit amino acid transport system substrate-binding protein